MDNQSSFVLAFKHLGNDLVEGNDFRLDVRRKQLQCQVRGGQRARDRDALLLDFLDGEPRVATIIGP